MQQPMLIMVLFLFGTLANAEVGFIADVKLTPAGSFKAKSTSVTGFATVTGDKVKAENISVKVKTLKTGLELRDKHMTEKYMEANKYPEITLLSATGKNGKGQGRVKMHGIEKDVEGTYKINGKELEADFEIKVSEFGITGVKYMGVGVHDTVKVHVVVPIKTVDATKKAQPVKKK